MRLLLKIERGGNAQGVDRSVQILEGERIVIGRGAAASIRLAAASVAPAHAVLEQSGEDLLIQDLGTLTGTQVNNRRIKTVTLQPGDRIRIGSEQLLVYREGDAWGIQQSILEGEAIDDDPSRLVAEQVKRFDVSHKLPSFLTLSLFVLGALTAIYLLDPIVTGRQAKWSSGPLAKVHQHLESDCAACHAEPFAPVRDSDCLACHSVKDHTDSFKGNAHHFAIGSKRCAECHHDHNGPTGVLPKDARLCSDCHARLTSVIPETKILDVASWDTHPEFRLTLREPEKSVRKVAPHTPEATDRTPLKLNHAVHLKENIRGANGKVTMTCLDCHSFSGGKQAPQPISFERNCQSCHLLEFDERFPSQQVPHGDTGKVREFLFAHYSKLVLGPDQREKLPEPARQKPGPVAAPEQYNRATLEIINGEVEKAETLIYTRTACQLCHQVELNPAGERTNGGFRIAPPAIPEVWFPQAQFNHRPHLSKDCGSCHKEVHRSEKTSDVLLPDVRTCQQCHSQKPAADRIQTDCSECHHYHAESALHAVAR